MKWQIIGRKFLCATLAWTCAASAQTEVQSKTPEKPTTQPATSQPADSAPVEPVPLELERVESLRSSFNPSLDQEGIVRFRLSREANVTLTLYGPNRERVRVLLDKQPFTKGDHQVTWDGRDATGKIVPDEAYFFVVKAESGEDSDVHDPLTFSGGERIVAQRVSASQGRRLFYQLPKPCRVLARAAVKEGPLLRTMVNWEPRPKGLCREDWDGMDANGLRSLLEVEGVQFGVMAYALPDDAFITTGNHELTYREFYERWGKQQPHKDPVKRSKKEESIISSHWHMPAHLNRDPVLSMTFLGIDEEKPADVKSEQSEESGRNDAAPADADAPPGDGPAASTQPATAGEVASEATSQPATKERELLGFATEPEPTELEGNPVLVRIDVPDTLERDFLNDQKFELIIYVDDKRILEVEQGHVPFTYPWDISGLKPGRHVITFNVASFRNHVGTVSRIVELP